MPFIADRAAKNVDMRSGPVIEHPGDYKAVDGHYFFAYRA